MGVQEIPNSVRTELLTHYEDDVTAAIGSGDLETLVLVTRPMYNVALQPKGRRSRRNSSLRHKGDQETTPEVGQYERLRAAVLSNYLAKMADIEPEVVLFRNEVLGGTALTLDQARFFLSSPATRYLTRDVWLTSEIPANHSATLLDENVGRTKDGPFHWVQVKVEPPDATHAVFGPQSYGYLSVPDEDGRPRRLSFWPDSLLGELRRMCKRITNAHPWDIDDATWFVLTGEVPSVRPIRSTISTSQLLGSRAYTTISLTIQPWVSPETVEMVYQQAQKQVIGGKPGRLSDKNLNLLQFATERADDSGNLPKGRILVQEWDRKWKHERPQWCYGPDTRRSWRDFRNTQRNVTNSVRAGILESWPEDMVEAAE